MAALVSSLFGWLVATIIYGLGYFLLNRNQAWIAVEIVAPITLIISLLANVAFLQLPRYFIKKAFFRSSRLVFGIGYSFLAYLTLQLTFGRAFGYNPVEQLAILNPVINGFVLGFVFRSIWNPNQMTSQNKPADDADRND